MMKVFGRQQSETDAVLVVGAGAAVAYGFPTGPGLFRDIRSLFRDKSLELGSVQSAAKTLFRERSNADIRTVEAAVGILAEILDGARVPSIDRFLEDQNDDVAEVGRVAIAKLLLQYERAASLSELDNAKDWYGHLWAKFLDRPRSSKPPFLHIISLNYDRSLETYLHRAVSSHYRYSPKGFTLEDLDKWLPILHLHGSLGDLRSQPYGGPRPEDDHRAIVAAAKSIKLLHQVDAYEEAVRLMKRSRAVCFLGFGFHRGVLERLFPEAYWSDEARNVTWPNIFGSAVERTESEDDEVRAFFFNRRFPKGGRIDFCHSESTTTLRSFPLLFQPVPDDRALDFELMQSHADLD